MVLPGWNVTEPLHVAAKFYVFIQKYRGAPEQIKAFAVQVNTFCAALRSFDSCLKNPDSIPQDDFEALTAVSEGCKRCADHCQAFLGTFFKQLDASAQDEVRAGDRLSWIWKKDEAITLKQDMNEQVGIINLHLNISHMKDRQRKNTAAPMPPDPFLTPAKLFKMDTGLNNELPANVAKPPAPIQPFRQSRTDSDVETIVAGPSPQLDPRRVSLAESLPFELLQRRDSDVTLGPLGSDKIMDNLRGVSILYNSRQLLPVQRLEFLKEESGSLRYIIAALPPGYSVKFFHRIPPVSCVIPHTEHPSAYNYKDALQIKFLEPHKLTSQRRTSSKNSYSPSIQSLDSQSTSGTPDTLPSNASISSASSILGSPSLSPTVFKYIEETNYPKYIFQNKTDYVRFQENIVGKELRLNAPVDTIISLGLATAKTREESYKQHLRLWRSGFSQTIMYYPNLVASAQYLEYDVNEPKSTDTSVRLDVKHSGVLKTKRQGSFKSLLSSPTRSSKTMKRSPEISGIPEKIELPHGLSDLAYICISFTEREDKKEFLEKAFLEPATTIPPLQFDQPLPRRAVS